MTQQFYIYPSEMKKLCPNKKPVNRMFITDLFTLAFLGGDYFLIYKVDSRQTEGGF